MTITKKITIGIITSIIALVALVFFLNFYVNKRIKDRLEKRFEESALTYDKLDVSILDRNVVLLSPNFRLEKYRISADRFKLKNLNYRDYIFKDRISFGAILVDGAKIILVKNDPVEGVKKDSSKSAKQKLINVDKVLFSNAQFSVREYDSTPNIMYTSIQELKFNKVHYDSLTSGNKIPFTYSKLNLKVDSLYYAMNPEHDLTLRSLTMDENLRIEDLMIKSKYTRRDFDKRQNQEKDQVSLKAGQINITDFVWEFKNDSLHMGGPFTKIVDSDLNVYRNKSLPDNPKINHLYSKRLREMGVKVDFDSIKLERSSVTYEEKVDAARPPAKISFKNLNANIYNFTNVYLNRKDFPETKVKASAILLDESKITFNMKFNVSDQRDEFNVYGRVGKISASAMNSFLKPAMNVLVKGEIESMYYNFNGNPEKAIGDMKIKYNGFKVEVLKKEGEKKNAILSGLANLIVKNNTNDKRMNQKDIEAVRNKNASFWNYFWLMLRNGAMKSFLKF